MDWEVLIACLKLAPFAWWAVFGKPLPKEEGW